MDIIKKLINKYWDVIPYLFFGVCTTIVNVVVYWFCSHCIHLGLNISTVIAWVLAVLFAYITNRKWVFKSEAHSAVEIFKEIISFFGCRIATGILDWGCMFLFVKKLKFNDIIIKVLANILVIILNYVASKIIIFKKKDFKEDNNGIIPENNKTKA